MATITSTMAGNLWKVLKNVGDTVEAGEEVAILESMKMEIPIEAESAGVVKQVQKNEGEFVNEGDVLFEIE
ncbi:MULTISPECIES: acetyl-CoA carboxylase biotin carboxyl carrier protein subunit [Geomicrobium]|uniref:Acetyl-CoA carboxylase biotin carboxyl carrier protein n=1 Tax=Geomicrobium sediminis TaxID=1347788 RepID=A0ABS2PF71_9BACL|nr:MULTISPECIES: acetyl-CoA carboxylase biotin carboxyl carrier protein subunit [Geomicrobium]MBM7633974.1 acetyl-CoA carboxylase biotin carboxyl carrier protein [Geomicrobium sediminis]GAK10294.1 biotin carboxyl carrier protein of methylcrotonyl-CoA carboxylase [Geomicrobium sp. JCM 19038]